MPDLYGGFDFGMTEKINYSLIWEELL